MLGWESDRHAIANTIFLALLDPVDHACAHAAGTCSQWEIYDEYVKDLERQRQDELMKAKGGKKQQQQQQQGSGPQHAKQDQVSTMQSALLQESLSTLDRMANQNMFEEIAMDFKYWDDASDAFRYAAGAITIACQSY